MQKNGDQIRETDVEAREGVNVKGMTTVLTVSIALAIVGLAALWWYFTRGT